MSAALPGVASGDSVGDEFAFRDRLTAMAATTPTLAADVLLRPERDPADGEDQPTVICLRLRDGNVTWAKWSYSRELDKLVYGVSDTIGELSIELGSAAEKALPRGFGEVVGGDLEIPNELASAEIAIAGFAVLAKEAARGGLVPESLRCRVFIDVVPYELDLDEVGFVLAPLHHWFDDAALRAWAHQILPPGQRIARATDGGEYPAGDASSPLTSGSIAKRAAAALDVGWQSINGTLVPRGTADARDQLIAAVRHPANAGPEHDELRFKIHDFVLDQLAHSEDKVAYLIDITRTEVEAVRKRMYGALANLNVPAAHHRLVEAFVTEPPDAAERVGAVLWRQDAAVELLVKQHLVGTPDQTVARRIVRLLIEEHIKVPRLWLEGADPRVLAQLGSLVTG